MKLLPRKAPQSLDEWLIIATWTLLPSVKARIRSEIEAHYTDAVQSLMLNGSPETAAQAIALANLGDARTAGRRFRQKQLTQFDVVQIRILLQFARSKFSLGIELLLLGLFLIIGMIHPKSDPIPFWLCMTVVLSYNLVGISAAVHSAVLARRPSTLANLRRLLLNHLIGVSSFAALLLAIFCGQRWTVLHSKTDNPHMDLLQMAALICLVSYKVACCLNYLRWRKLLITADNDWNDLSPRQPTVA